MMASDKKDKFVEELDRELHAIESRLKKVVSEANALLKEHRQTTGAEDDGEAASEEEDGP
jgi:hypothetical protein